MEREREYVTVQEREGERRACASGCSTQHYSCSSRALSPTLNSLMSTATPISKINAKIWDEKHCQLCVVCGHKESTEQLLICSSQSSTLTITWNGSWAENALVASRVLCWGNALQCMTHTQAYFHANKLHIAHMQLGMQISHERSRWHTTPRGRDKSSKYQQHKTKTKERQTRRQRKQNNKIGKDDFGPRTSREMPCPCEMLTMMPERWVVTTDGCFFLYTYIRTYLHTSVLFLLSL